MPLTQKEILYLQEYLKHEEMCAAKYHSYAQQLQDPELRELFDNLSRQELKHFETISKLLQQDQ